MVLKNQHILSRFPVLRGLILALIMSIAACHAGAQNFDNTDSVYNKIILKKEYAFEGIVHTTSWGIGFRKGYNSTVFRRRMLEFELVGMKSPKEVRTVNPYVDNSKSFVYGKLNSVFILRGGYGWQRLLNRKPYWGGVEVRYIYNAGLLLGMAKPIYLYILNFSSDYMYHLTTERYDPSRHYLDNIYGRAPFTNGFDKLSFYPGAYAKAGLNFEFGKEDRRVRSLEAGAIVDFFPVAIPIMAYNTPKNAYLTLYLSLNIGKRYNRYPKEDKISSPEK